MQVYFARHGQTPSSFSGRLRSEDESLSAQGRAAIQKTADDLRRELGDVRLARVITSPKHRAAETAAIFAHTFSFTDDLEVDERLDERNCDAYAGQLVADVFAHSEAELVAGGMEPEEAVYRRTKQLFDDVVSNASEDDVILLVGHSTTLRPLALIMQGAPFGTTIDMPKVTLEKAWRLI